MNNKSYLIIGNDIYQEMHISINSKTFHDTLHSAVITHECGHLYNKDTKKGKFSLISAFLSPFFSYLTMRKLGNNRLISLIPFITTSCASTLLLTSRMVQTEKNADHFAIDLCSAKALHSAACDYFIKMRNSAAFSIVNSQRKKLSETKNVKPISIEQSLSNKNLLATHLPLTERIDFFLNAALTKANNSNEGLISYAKDAQRSLIKDNATTSHPREIYYANFYLNNHLKKAKNATKETEQLITLITQTQKTFTDQIAYENTIDTANPEKLELFWEEMLSKCVSDLKK